MTAVIKMTGATSRTVVLAASLVLAFVFPAAAQTLRPAEKSEELQPEELETDELHSRDVPIVGETPSAPDSVTALPTGRGLLDMRCGNELGSHALSLLDDGTVIVRTTGGGSGDKEQHTRLAASELTFHRRLVAAADLSGIDEDLREGAAGLWGTQCEFWVRQGAGVRHFRWSELSLLPLPLARLRDTLEGIGRSAVEEKPHQDPFAQYAPQKGDYLFDWTGRRYLLLGFDATGQVLELETDDRVVRVVIERRELVDRFASWLRLPPRTE